MTEAIIDWRPLENGVFEAVRRLGSGWSLRSVAVALGGGGWA